jgi:hypothetical protein
MYVCIYIHLLLTDTLKERHADALKERREDLTDGLNTTLKERQEDFTDALHTCP